MQNDPILPILLWPFLTLICIAFILAGLKAVLKKTDWPAGRQQKIFYTTAGVLLLWIALLSVLALQGFFADFGRLPPRPGLAILAPLPVILFIAFSKTGTALLRLVPAQWLVLMQSFRIIVELLLWMGFVAGKLPVQMTFEGRNFDVLTGLLALPVGYYIARSLLRGGTGPRAGAGIVGSQPGAGTGLSAGGEDATRSQAGVGPLTDAGIGSWSGSSRILALAFNIAGLLLLFNIMAIALLSMPTPIRYFMNEPAATLVAHFPFIFLPGVLVPLAYTLHIFSLRQLWLGKNIQQGH
ncbi:MAG TPA: hypothetical protein VK563_03865 [Puia sp.]|nr:hypothetical protein [Puia sp.]